MVNISGQKKRDTNMANIKNVLLHCMETEQKYKTMKLSDDKDRMRNKGWIEALEFVKEHFDIDLNTIKQK